MTRAKGGQSEHNFGVAVDVVPFENGKPNWNVSNLVWIQIGTEAEVMGLEWGGRWKKFLDRPHIQLPAPPVIRLFGLYKQGGLPAVWSAVEQMGVK